MSILYKLLPVYLDETLIFEKSIDFFLDLEYNENAEEPCSAKSYLHIPIFHQSPIPLNMRKSGIRKRERDAAFSLPVFAACNMQAAVL